MQRWCAKLRSLSLYSVSRPSPSLSSTSRLLHTSAAMAAPTFHQPLAIFSYNIRTLFSSYVYPLARHEFASSNLRLSLAQMRHFSAKSKEKKWKKLTPAISKVKKYKIKGYSSYKGRFRLMNDGNIRRWREGKRHNAFSKSKIAKRRLRRPEIVHAAYAKVMKKLNFSIA